LIVAIMPPCDRVGAESAGGIVDLARALG
jgi:hypothetical protein